jgi:nitroreductase
MIPGKPASGLRRYRSSVELAEVIDRRRMVRSFSGRPVDPGALDRLLRAALRAPSAGNAGGWSIVVLCGEEERFQFWDATTTRPWRAGSRRWPGLSRAPVVMVVLADPAAYAARYAEPDKASSGLDAIEAWPIPYWFMDAGSAVMSLLLSAVDAGFGACFLGNFRGEDVLLERLGIPSRLRYVGAVLLGEAADADHPSSSLARGPRRMEDVVHRGRWGSPQATTGAEPEAKRTPATPD